MWRRASVAAAAKEKAKADLSSDSEEEEQEEGVAAVQSVPSGPFEVRWPH